MLVDNMHKKFKKYPARFKRNYVFLEDLVGNTTSLTSVEFKQIKLYDDLFKHSITKYFITVLIQL